MESEYARAHIFVSGRVQGVNFRARTRDQARLAGLAGWVRNLDDGRVEILAEGRRAAVEHVTTWCRHGPPGARVEHFELHWEPYIGDEEPFRVVW